MHIEIKFCKKKHAEHFQHRQNEYKIEKKKLNLYASKIFPHILFVNLNKNDLALAKRVSTFVCVQLECAEERVSEYDV